MTNETQTEATVPSITETAAVAPKVEVVDWEAQNKKRREEQEKRANSHYFNLYFNTDLSLWVVTEHFVEEGKEDKMVAAFPDLKSARKTQSEKSRSEVYVNDFLY